MDKQFQLPTMVSGSVSNLETFHSLGQCLSCDLGSSKVYLETLTKFWFLVDDTPEKLDVFNKCYVSTNVKKLSVKSTGLYVSLFLVLNHAFSCTQMPFCVIATVFPRTLFQLWLLQAWWLWLKQNHCLRFHHKSAEQFLSSFLSFFLHSALT